MATIPSGTAADNWHRALLDPGMFPADRAPAYLIDGGTLATKSPTTTPPVTIDAFPNQYPGGANWPQNHGT